MSVFVERVVFDGDAFISTKTASIVTEAIFAAQTIDDVANSTIDTAERLSLLGISKGCEVVLDSNADGSLVVRMSLVKQPSISARIGTSLSSQSAELSGALALRNMTGNGDTLSLSFSQDSSLQDSLTSPSHFDAGKTFSAALEFPRNANADERVHITASKQSKNMSELCGHHQQSTNLSVKYLLLNRNSGNHDIEAGIALRNNNKIDNDVSWREDAGQSLKSFVAHSLVFDSRDDPILARSGALLKSRQEFAGLVGDACHFKTETESQVSSRLPLGFSTTLSARCGLILPFYGAKVRVNDKFFVGGPQSLRGFKQGSIGPKDQGNMLGGNVYYNVCASLFTPLPFIPLDSPVHGHLFFNSANLVLTDGQSATSVASTLSATSRLSVGAGIALRFSIIRAEFNYAIPLAATATDTYKTGFQFGIGMEFF